MEILVGALVVLGFLAILARFVTRDASGEIRLPRVVDDSIGMWTLRRITGRRLGERAWEDELDGELQLDPNASEPTRAALGAIAAATAANVVSASRPAFAPAANAVAPSAVAPIVRPRVAAEIARPAYVAQRRRTKGRPVRAGSMMSATPVLDLRRRQEALTRPARRSRWPRRIAALGSIAALLIVAVVVAAVLGSRFEPQGKVLAATGRPQSASDSTNVAAAASGAPRSALPVAISLDVTRPKAAITGLTSATINGNSSLRLTLTWTLTDSGSGLRSQRLQRRTDGGAWVNVSLASAATRKAAFAMARGHTYTFRIRGTDRAGNVGLFASKSIRI